MPILCMSHKHYHVMYYMYVAHFLDRSMQTRAQSLTQCMQKHWHYTEEMAKVIYSILGHTYVHIPYACNTIYISEEAVSFIIDLIHDVSRLQFSLLHV